MILKKIQELFSIAKKEYSSHPFFSVLMPIIAKTEIRRNDKIRTAHIFLDEEEPLIEFSPSFCDKYVKSPEDILFILAHEICHLVLGHLNSMSMDFANKYGRKATNLAFDIIIDHLLYKHFGEKTKSLKIVNFYLESKCPHRLLLPSPFAKEDEFEGEKCREIFNYISSGAPLTPYRIIQHILSHKKFHYISMVEKEISDHFFFRREASGYRSRLGPLTETLLK
ncbi:MAG: hypothetical protein N2445_06755, partial [Acidobacteria bacterium]|nr:hypothetical protein [Acidobacteriota bacterium]